MDFVAANSTNYTKGRTQPIKYIVIHFTANDGDTAQGNAKYFSQPNRGASAHYFVDEHQTIQTVKDSDTAWHCGAKTYKHNNCRNANAIGIEMCSDKVNGKYVITDDTISNAVELAKSLMAKYNIPIDNVLRHYDVTGKNCPAPFVEDKSKWIDFKSKLTGESEDKMKIYKHTTDMPEWAREAVIKAINKGYITVNGKGEISVYEPNLQVIVWLNRMGLLDK